LAGVLETTTTYKYHPRTINLPYGRELNSGISGWDAQRDCTVNNEIGPALSKALSCFLRVGQKPGVVLPVLGTQIAR
jgi:hypothetical protein